MRGARREGTNLALRRKIPVAGVLLLTALAVLSGDSPAGAQSGGAASSGSAYSDPEGAQQRTPTADVEPIYRGPALDTMAMIRTRGVLRVGVAVAEPAIMHDRSGALVGFGVDVAHEIAESLGVDVELVETSWRQIIPDLLDRHFDLIASGMWVTPERALVVNFTRPTASEGVYLIANKELAAKARSLPDFDRPEIRLAVFAGSTQEAIARRLLPRATLVRVEGENADQLAPVIEGKAHAALVATFAPAAIVESAPDRLFLPLPAPLRSTITAVAVRKGDPDFLNFLDSLLAVREADGWLEERQRFWREPANWVQRTTAGFSPASMDRHADPREDFYRYAAGGWLDRAVIPPSESQASQMSELSLAIDDKLIEIIHEAAASPGTAGTPRQQIGDFYRSAMSLDRIEKAGLAPLEADLARAAAIDSPTTLAAFSARLQLAFGGTPLINVGVLPDAKQSDVNALYILPGAGTLNRSEYLDDVNQEVRDNYVAHIAEIFELAGDSAEVARRRAEGTLAIERELAAGTLSPVEAADPNATYNRMTVTELQALVPGFDIAAFLRALDISTPAYVIVTEPRAMATLQRVLAGRSPEEIRTLLRWRVLDSFAESLPARFAHPSREYSRRYRGLEESPSRERVVTGQIRALYPHPLSRLYVERHFPEATRAAVETMVGNIRAEFRSRLEGNSWLTAETRDQALAKLDRLRITVGSPATWIDMSSVAVEPDAYLVNIQRALEFTVRRGLATLGMPVNPDPFSVPGRTTPVDVNAAYIRPYNSIEISAAILQPPFFDPRLDPAVNYCTIGAVIGHEITHGFDSGGRLYDATGTLRNWWSEQDANRFNAQAELLVKQYDGYEILPGVTINGALTVGENIADLGGMTLAYEALERSMAGRPRPAMIDGMTPEQRCFVGWAQLWMAKTRPEVARQRAATDPHAESAFRASGPLVNMDEFFSAFGIVEGDPMWRDPALRVHIW